MVFYNQKGWLKAFNINLKNKWLNKPKTIHGIWGTENPGEYSIQKSLFCKDVV